MRTITRAITAFTDPAMGGPRTRRPKLEMGKNPNSARTNRTRAQVLPSTEPNPKVKSVREPEQNPNPIIKELEPSTNPIFGFFPISTDREHGTCCLPAELRTPAMTLYSFKRHLNAHLFRQYTIVWMSGSLRGGKSPRYVTGLTGRLSLAIPPWVGAMTAGDGYGHR